MLSHVPWEPAAPASAVVSVRGARKLTRSSRHVTCAPPAGQVIVKLLGFAIIAGAFTYKVPQIKKLVDAQEARGLSFLSTYVETACFGSVVVYHVLMGNPVSAWGENAIIMLQQVAVMGLMWKYTSTSTAHVALVSAGLLGLFAFQLSLPQQYWYAGHTHAPLQHTHHSNTGTRHAVHDTRAWV